VLGPGGVFCVAIPNPVNGSEAARCRYFDQTPGAESLVRNGLTMDLIWIERLREPRPTAETVTRHPALASARDRPFFVHLRCRRAAAAPRRRGAELSQSAIRRRPAWTISVRSGPSGRGRCRRRSPAGGS
jgi:hypothetical protein